MQYDVIVVGGSYAGMAAALQIARARRKVMVVDAGLRRNRFAEESHGFLGQDGRPPGQIAEEAKAQLLAYPNVVWTEGRARGVANAENGFEIEMENGHIHSAQRVVLALGVADTLPDVPGLQERWGKSVFHCPYCHGYELGNGSIGVLATGPASMHQAMLIPEWGRTTFFTNDAFAPDEEQLAQLAARGVTVERTPVAAVTGHADLRLADGRIIALAGLFTATSTRPASPLAEELGCALEQGPLGPYVRTDPMKETSVSGVFACGDLARGAGSVSLAVGDGALAGSAVHRSLVFG
jgi:thioredoxin reductase